LVWEEFSKQTAFSVGGGNRIKFWFDKWCGDTPLKDLFPLLFDCASNQDASIESVMSSPISSNPGTWNISFVRDFNDGELPVIVSFFKFLHPLFPRRERLDAMVWKPRNSGQFDVRSFYCALQAPNRTKFPWKGIWGVKAPRRLSFFIWTAARGKILTYDNLMKRGHILAGWCCLCKNHWETGDHLLLHCEIASALWCFVLQSFGIQWVIPATVIDLLFGWYNWFGKLNSGVWNLVLLCLMWSLWKERNRRIFEDLEKTLSHLKEQFLGLLYDCSRTWGLTAEPSLPDFIASLNTV
jgi:hypothetical protein